MKPVALSAVLDWLKSNGYFVRDSIDGADCVENAASVDFLLSGFASVEKAGPADVSFWVGDTVKSETNAPGFSCSLLEQIRAGLIFVPENFNASLPNAGCVVPVKNPYHVMVEFLNKFAVENSVDDGRDAECDDGRSVDDCYDDCRKIHASARIHSTAVVDGVVGEDSVVGPHCVVMAGAKIGANCVLEAGVTIYPNVVIGDGCIFQAGVVVGSCGFGFYEYEGKRRMVPHVAGVRIGERCSFGANTVVAAGFISPTTIGNDSHFDSMVQIAHNCTVGNNVYMASQTAIAGSVTLEDDVEFAGGAKAAGHLTVGKGAHVAAKAGVTKSVPAGRTVSGFPAVDIDVWRRQMVELRVMAKKHLKK